MERFIGIETARGKLGHLVEEVAAGNSTVVLTKRGGPKAALVNREEYEQFRLARTEHARRELTEKLRLVRQQIRESGLAVDLVEEAIAAVRDSR